MISDSEIDNICTLYTNKLTIKEISNITNRDRDAISRILRKKNLRNVVNYPKDTKDKVIDLHINYNKTIMEISKELNINFNTITNMIIRSGNINKFPKQKYTCDNTYFATINSEEKAYWLGFIAADGNVTNTIQNTLHIGIHSNDHNHLIKFKTSINATNPVVKKEYISKNKISKISRIDIYNAQIVDDLIKLGIYPNKTKILSWNELTKNIPPYFIRHFVRGYFDGDGSWKSKKSPAFNILSASPYMLDGLQAWLQTYNLTKIKIQNRTNYWVYEKGGRHNLMILYNMLYLNSTVFLERKHESIYNFLFKIA